MNCTTKSLIWAGLMIAAAYTAKELGVSDMGSMLLIGAMLVGFFATQKRGGSCARG